MVSSLLSVNSQLRRLARSSVMEVRREATNVSPTAVGLSGNADLSQVRVVDHLTPKMQKVYAEAKAFKGLLPIPILLGQE